MQDPVLLDLMQLSSFSKDDFVSVYSKHHPLNMMDPIWKFVVEEEIAKYIESGAFESVKNSSGSGYSVTSVVRKKYSSSHLNSEEAIAI
jgi:hypothetical protein